MSRLAECLELMERDGIDVLVLGREANTRTVADVRRLWLAGTRVFAPGCVVVARTAAVHVLANTDAVVTADLPLERLYGVTWNPERLLGALAAIEGVTTAHRIGADGMNPMAHALLTRLAPAAEFVDAGPLFAALWAIPDPEKLSGVALAAQVATFGLGSMVDALRPGARPRDVRGACAAAFAAKGVTTPAFEAVAAPLAPDASTWLPPERTFGAGEHVILRAGALRAGWEASVARTYVVGAAPVEQPAPSGWDDLLATCVPGTAVGTLRERGAVVHGVGRGVEPWPDDLALVDGLTAAIEMRDDSSARQDVVRITDAEPALLTSPVFLTTDGGKNGPQHPFS